MALIVFFDDLCREQDGVVCPSLLFLTSQLPLMILIVFWTSLRNGSGCQGVVLILLILLELVPVSVDGGEIPLATPPFWAASGPLVLSLFNICISRWLRSSKVGVISLPQAA